jgi:hypothetical protein
MTGGKRARTSSNVARSTEGSVPGAWLTFQSWGGEKWGRAAVG